MWNDFIRLPSVFSKSPFWYWLSHTTNNLVVRLQRNGGKISGTSHVTSTLTEEAMMGLSTTLAKHSISVERKLLCEQRTQWWASRRHSFDDQKGRIRWQIDSLEGYAAAKNCRWDGRTINDHWRRRPVMCMWVLGQLFHLSHPLWMLSPTICSWIRP